MSVFVREIAKADVPAAIAAGVPETVIGEAQFDCTVTEVTIVSESALTAADATARTLTLYNRGQAGAGTTVVATLVTNLAGGNWTANDEKAFTLTATVADRNLAAGDVLELVETVASTGTARGESQVVVRGTAR
jgi:hypothetical protein